MQHRQEVDQYLDALYNNNVRCPYCRAKIRKYTTTCPRCGITKTQIHKASNQEAIKIIKEKSDEKIFMSRRRPEDVQFTAVAMRAIIGFTGLHCFFVGRRIRGWIIASFTIIGLLGLFVVPQSTREVFHAVYLVDGLPVFFPTDYLVLIAAILWWYDLAAVAFGFFKYPIRIPRADPAKKAAATDATEIKPTKESIKATVKKAIDKNKAKTKPDPKPTPKPKKDVQDASGA